MNDSSMDLTDVISSTNEFKRSVTQEKNEAILQENYELKKKIELLERVNRDMASELSFVTNENLKEKSKYSDVQSELNAATFNIKQLESQLEEDKLQIEIMIKENEDNRGKHVADSTVVVPDQDQLDIFTGQIQNLEALREEDQILKQQMLEENDECTRTIDQLKAEKKLLQSELSELKEHLELKVEDNRILNENLESIREEKLLLNTELQMLKSSNNNASRGNSLFAEVEDNRQIVIGQRELLKTKYFNLKNDFKQQQQENKKLKLEIARIRREDKDDEKTFHSDYCVLIDTLKCRNSELEKEAMICKQKLDKHPIIVTEGDLKKFQLINSILDGARNDSKELQKELDRRGSQYVSQGHQLFASQKENRRLNASIKKLQSDIDELKLKLDVLKSAKESVEDGISPPATEIALEYQKQKIVKFKEAVEIHNLPQIKEEDKENKVSLRN